MYRSNKCIIWNSIQTHLSNTLPQIYSVSTLRNTGYSSLRQVLDMPKAKPDFMDLGLFFMVGNPTYMAWSFFWPQTFSNGMMKIGKKGLCFRKDQMAIDSQ